MEYKTTLYRLVGKRNPNGHGRDITVEVSMVLTAHSNEQLANMVNIASVDGWREKHES